MTVSHNNYYYRARPVLHRSLFDVQQLFQTLYSPYGVPVVFFKVNNQRSTNKKNQKSSFSVIMDPVLIKNRETGRLLKKYNSVIFSHYWPLTACKKSGKKLMSRHGKKLVRNTLAIGGQMDRPVDGKINTWTEGQRD